MVEAPARALESLVVQLAPSRLLVAGAVSEAVCRPYLENCGGRCTVQRLQSCELPAALETVERVDLAVLSQCLEYAPKKTGEHLIARLRDIHAQRLLLFVALDGAGAGLTRWQAADLFALGLYGVGEYQAEGRRLGAFAFDIADYKLTPDWLNARYWAHPELFGKYWW